MGYIYICLLHVYIILCMYIPVYVCICVYVYMCILSGLTGWN